MNKPLFVVSYYGWKRGMKAEGTVLEAFDTKKQAKGWMVWAKKIGVQKVEGPFEYIQAPEVKQ
jgi:hypothetical protein